MLTVLAQVERKLPELLRQEELWKSLDVDYHPPRVERLWMQFGDTRIYLHCIHPCEPNEALFHPHPWPSAMRIIHGRYEMGVGYGEGNEAPPVAAKLVLPAGTLYEMNNPHGWHWVRPVETPCYTMMVAGPLWDREAPTSVNKPLKPLSAEAQARLFSVFRDFYTHEESTL